MEDTFPRESTRPEILRWLAGNSDLSPDTVVTMTDEVVVAVTSREEGRGVGRSTRLGLREEVINPDAAAAWGGRSIQLDLDLDCARHRVILGVRRIYARPNLQGTVRITRSDNAWAEVPADTVIDDVARAACSPKPATRLAEAPPASDSTTVAAASAGAQSGVAQSAVTRSAVAQSAVAQNAVAQNAAVEPVPAKAALPEGAAMVSAPLQTAAAEPPAKAASPEDAAAVSAPPPTQVAVVEPPPGPPVAEAATVTKKPAEAAEVAAEPLAAVTVAIAAPPPTSVVVVGAQGAPQSGAAPELKAPELKASADPSVMVHNPFVDAPAASRAPAPARPPVRMASAAAPAQHPTDFAVQIAAVATADLAHDSWQSLKARFPSLIGSRTFAAEPVETNGRTLYRALLLGFASPTEAADLCKTLRGQSVDCILRQLK